MARSKMLQLTSMESRIVPAAIFTYPDVDGDLVTIRTSKGTNEQLASIVHLTPIGKGLQLETIFLNADELFSETDLSITAKRLADGGDGVVNVGYIDAQGSTGGKKLDLGTVFIGGDLGEIDAGDGVSVTPALKSLTVRSLGALGTSTGAPTLQSVIDGRVGSFNVVGDIRSALFSVRDTNGENGTIGNVTIGGSVVGGSTANSGSIQVQDGLERLTVRDDIVGGTGDCAGSIISYGSLGGIRVEGSLIGGSGNRTGMIEASTGDPKRVFIGGDLRGGSGSGSGGLAARSFGGVVIEGSVIGASGSGSGVLIASASIGKLSIARDLRGGNGVNSGYVDCGTRIESASIGGSVIGGSQTSTGLVFAWGGMGRVNVGRDLRGGAGTNNSGTILSYGPLGSVSIGGSVVGGAGATSGSIACLQSIGTVTVGGDVLGGPGVLSGAISSDLTLAKLTIRGSLVAGVGAASGRIGSNGATGLINIGGDVRGGSSIWSGQIYSGDSLESARIGGSLIGGSGEMTGAISVSGTLASVKIGGDIRGADAHGVVVRDSGTVQAQRIVRLNLGGSIVAGRVYDSGSLLRSGSVQANDDLGTILVKGSLVGNPTNNVLVTARGSAHPTKGKDVAIQSFTVQRSVEYTSILAGYSIGKLGQNADAQIGSVTVGGSWTASSVNAGLTIGFFGFGNGYETKLAGGANDSPDTHSRIGSLSIGGPVFGASGSQEPFGFGAEEVGSARFNGRLLSLTPGRSNETFSNHKAVPLGSSISYQTNDAFAVHVFEA